MYIGNFRVELYENNTWKVYWDLRRMSTIPVLTIKGVHGKNYIEKLEKIIENHVHGRHITYSQRYNTYDYREKHKTPFNRALLYLESCGYKMKSFTRPWVFQKDNEEITFATQQAVINEYKQRISFC